MRTEQTYNVFCPRSLQPRTRIREQGARRVVHYVAHSLHTLHRGVRHPFYELPTEARGAEADEERRELADEGEREESWADKWA
jgi:hypothetical protein